MPWQRLNKPGVQAGRTVATVSLRALIVCALAALALGAGLHVGLTGARHAAVAPARHAPLARGRSATAFALQGSLSAIIGARERAYRVTAAPGGFAADNRAQRLALRFDLSGARVGSGDRWVRLSAQAA